MYFSCLVVHIYVLIIQESCSFSLFMTYDLHDILFYEYFICVEDEEASSSEDINHLLFSAIVPGN